MRENGFLELEFGEVTLGDLLLSKPNKELFVARLEDDTRKVMAVMRQNAISQMPVVGTDGALVGLLDEVDLLNHMLEGRQPRGDQKIKSLVQNAKAVFPSEATLDEAMPSLTEGYALIVVNQAARSAS